MQEQKNGHFFFNHPLLYPIMAPVCCSHYFIQAHKSSLLRYLAYCGRTLLLFFFIAFIRRKLTIIICGCIIFSASPLVLLLKTKIFCSNLGSLQHDGKHSLDQTEKSHPLQKASYLKFLLHRY